MARVPVFLNGRFLAALKCKNTKHTTFVSFLFQILTYLFCDITDISAPENVLYCLSRLVLFFCKYAVVVIGHFSTPRVTFVNFVPSLFGLISEDC